MRIRQVFLLYRALLNVQFGFSSLVYYHVRRRERLWEPLLIAVAIGSALATLIVVLWHFTSVLYKVGLSLNQPEVILVFSITAAQVLTLFFGIFLIISSFYFSDDLRILMPLPLQARELLAAKFLMIITGQYIAVLFFVVPVWIFYAIRTPVSLLFVVNGLFVALSLPILPLVVAMVVVIMAMRFVNVSPRRDTFTIALGFLLLFGVIVLQFALQGPLGMGDPEDVLLDLLAEDGLVRQVGRMFPPSLWAAFSLTHHDSLRGLGYLLGIGLVNGVALLLLFTVGERVLFRGILAGWSGGSASRGRTWTLAQPAVLVSHPLLALAATEVRLFLRTPVYVLNGLSVYIIAPVMLAIPIVVEEGPIAAWMGSLLIDGWAAVAAIAVYLVLLCGFSAIPVTTFSREGRYLWQINVLPLKKQQVFTGKLLGFLAVHAVASVPGTLVLSVLLQTSWSVVSWGFVLGLWMSVGFGSLLIRIDFARPMLDWVDPARAVKSNLNVIIALVLSVLVVILLGFRIYAGISLGHTWRLPWEFALVGLLFVGLVRAWSEPGPSLVRT